MSVTELIGGAIGCTLLALGGASIVAWTLRRRPANRLMLFFGIWCCLSPSVSSGNNPSSDSARRR